MVKIAKVILTSVLAFACAKNLKPLEPTEPKTNPLPPQEGAIYYEGAPFVYIFSDLRARRVGDIVLVRIEEITLAQHEQRSELTRDSEFGTDFSASAQIGKDPSTSKGGQASAGTIFKSKNRFKGRGIRKATGKVVALVAAEVKAITPTGNLVIEGRKVMEYAGEVQEILVSGVVRPQDIMPDNSVPSTMLAMAKIDLKTKGDATRKNKQGWFQKLMDVIWPF